MISGRYLRHADLFENDAFEADLCDNVFETCALTWRQHLYLRIVDMYTRIHVRVYVYAY